MANKYQQNYFEGEKPFCDVVMKGGITSGVVYPLAICELAKKYKLQRIGGTSAGAVAAAVTAAAEYARESGGYVRLSDIPDEVSNALSEKFQPEPHLRPLFEILFSLLKKQTLTSFVVTALRAYWIKALLGALPGLAIATLTLANWVRDSAFLIGWSPGWLLFGVLLAAAGSAIMVGLALYRSLVKDLPEARYGLCSGLTVEPDKGPALTDWLADTIDRVANYHVVKEDEEGEFAKPLTFGDLKATKDRHEIQLAIMTTDLSTRRPYRLPFREDTHFFDKSEFAELLPDRVIRYMLKHAERCEGDDSGNIYHFPPIEELPIVVAARMSYSFPGFIQAVPVYQCDHTLISETERKKPVRCLFSDGGLSSNFPIHFFDRLWPNSPTFGIALNPFNKKRHPDEHKRAQIAKADGDDILPILEITGLSGFIMSLFDAAKDWQDNLQSVLPGYRERVIHIALKDDEGGFNLTMPRDLTKKIAGYGADAGKIAVNDFDLERHRWNRFVIAMARIDEKLEELVKAYGKPEVKESFSAFLEKAKEIYKPQNNKDQLWLSRTLDRATTLVMNLGKEWRNSPTVREGRIPRGDFSLRIAPEE